MTETENDDGLLIAEEVSRLLRIKPATVYEAAAKGRIPFVQLWKGKRKALIRFRREDIDRLIADRVRFGEEGAK
jgi:excisionase family DNA binding protein